MNTWATEELDSSKDARRGKVKGSRAQVLTRQSKDFTTSIRPSRHHYVAEQMRDGRIDVVKSFD